MIDGRVARALWALIDFLDLSFWSALAIDAWLDVFDRGDRLLLLLGAASISFLERWLHSLDREALEEALFAVVEELRQRETEG